MSRILNRALAGALAFLSAVAVADVSTAHAQTTGTGIVPTACMAGVLTECGQREITTCSWKIDLNLSTLPWGGGISIFKQECRVTGHYKLYKDVKENSFNPCVTKGLDPLGMPIKPEGSTDEWEEVFLDGGGAPDCQE